MKSIAKRDRCRGDLTKGSALLGFLLFLTVVLASAPASAALTHTFSSSFGSFASLQGVAVAQSSGDVYVLDVGTGTLQKFDAAGSPLSFSALGSNTIEGVGGANAGENELAVDNSAGPASGDIYVANGSHIGIYAATGALLGELNGEVESQVPGAPWGEPCGVAVDATGHVYVGLYPNYVSKYTPAANPVVNTNYTTSMAGVSSVCNVAVNSAGSVYAAAIFGGVTTYDALQFGSLEATGTPLDEHGSSLAVDPGTDDVYVDEGSEVAQYDAAGDLLGSSSTADLSFSSAVAVNAATGHLYVADNTHGSVDIFGGAVVGPTPTTGVPSGLGNTSVTLNGTVDPAGLPVTDCQFEYGKGSYTSTIPCSSNPGSGSGAVPVAANATGLEPNTAYQFRLAASNANGTTLGHRGEFTTLSPPLVEGSPATAVGISTATLQAQVDPVGFDTTYRFEYGSDTSYGTSIPASAQDIGGGSGYLTVSQLLVGLQGATTYHYRVVATNANGTTDGPDRTFKTFPLAETASDTCANAKIRELQQASLLPDCRAYELVSPPEKDGGNVAADPTFTQSTPAGDAIKFTSTSAFADAQASEARGAEYVSQRGSEGWTTHSINPRQVAPLESIYMSTEYQAFSEDLTKGVYYALTPFQPGHPNVEKVANLYLRTDVLSAPPGNYELLSDSFAALPPRGTTTQAAETRFAAASADWTRIIFETKADLTPEAASSNPNLPKLYEWHDGTERLAGILPDGTAAPGSSAGAGAGVENVDGGWTQDTISADGSRIVFEAAPLSETPNATIRSGNLFMRINGVETIKLNAGERSQPDPGGEQPAQFWAATPDDSKVFFTTSEALTNDATPGGFYYYMYDMDAPAGRHLTLLAAQPNDGGGAINGISTDGSYVYFTSAIPLLPGDPEARPGDVYVWHNGALRFVVLRTAEIGFGGVGDTLNRGWGEAGRINGQELRVAPDGRNIAFGSTAAAAASRAGAENNTGYGEVYVYSYDSGKLTCASCNPSGAKPTSQASFTTDLLIDAQDAYGPTEHMSDMYRDRAISDDGRYVFFDTVDALVAQDTNGRRDVYEYDTATDQVHLISSGTCDCNSAFVDASADGSNVFFTTHQQLVRADVDSNGDLYDARINGGIPSQNVTAPTSCEGDDCQGPAASAPGFSLPASATFAGAGNAASPPAKKVTKKTKAKPLTRAQKLAKELKACKRKTGRQRASCQSRARKRYGAKKSEKAKKSAKRASHRAGR
jgi:hypothetical protein